jgi:hypothetical protein
MTRFATGRLTEASATLEPAQRALLNLWVNHGLDDEALARLSRLDVVTVAARRTQIVERLSTELGLPPTEVRGALDEIAASSHDALAAHRHAGPTNGAVPEPEVSETAAPAAGASQTPAPAAGAPQTPAPAAGETAGEGPALPTEEAVPKTRLFGRRTWIALLVLGIVLVVVVVVALASADGSHPPSGTRSTPASPGPTPTTATAPTSPNPPAASSTSPSPGPGRGRRPRRRAAGPAPAHSPLIVLPGAGPEAGGSVVLLGPRSHPRIEVTVRGLITAQGGHYEAWLYNSILDSNPLAGVRSPSSHTTVRLPRDYRRFRWIDISFQPTGMVNDSGESVLRAATPR